MRSAPGVDEEKALAPAAARAAAPAVPPPPLQPAACWRSRARRQADNRMVARGRMDSRHREALKQAQEGSGWPRVWCPIAEVGASRDLDLRSCNDAHRRTADQTKGCFLAPPAGRITHGIELSAFLSERGAFSQTAFQQSTWRRALPGRPTDPRLSSRLPTPWQRLPR